MNECKSDSDLAIFKLYIYNHVQWGDRHAFDHKQILGNNFVIFKVTIIEYLTWTVKSIIFMHFHLFNKPPE